MKSTIKFKLNLSKQQYNKIASVKNIKMLQRQTENKTKSFISIFFQQVKKRYESTQTKKQRIKTLHASLKIQTKCIQLSKKTIILANLTKWTIHSFQEKSINIA
jgi:hypothetical protein